MMERKNLEITNQLQDSYLRKKGYKDQYEIIMELAIGSPVDALIKHGNLNPIDLLDIGLGTAESIRDLHQTYRLQHKDIKTKSKPDQIPTRILEFAIDKKSREEIPDYYNLLMEKKAENIKIYPQHRERIIELLQEKNEHYLLDTLGKGDPRMPIISSVINKFERGEEFTYKKLLNELRELEEKLIENRPSKFFRFFEKNYGIFRSNPSKAVHKEIKKIEKDLGIRKKNK